MMIAYLLLSVCRNPTANAVHAAGKSHVMLDSYQVTDQGVVPGKDFELTLKLLNTSTASEVSSLLLTFGGMDNYAQRPYGKSDQIYIDSIGAGQTAEVKTTFRAGQSIKGSGFPIRVNVVYYDSAGTERSNTFTIQVPILSVWRGLVIQNVSYPKEVFTDTAVKVQTIYKNTGAAEYRNVKMNISGDGEVTAQPDIDSNIAGGEVGYADMSIRFVKPGSNAAKISFSYQDATGNTYLSDTYDLKLEVQGTGASDTSKQTATSVAQNEKWSYKFLLEIVLAISILAMAIVTLLLLRRERR